MAYHSFLLEPISCHAWNKDRTRKYTRGAPSQMPRDSSKHRLSQPNIPTAGDAPRMGQSQGWGLGLEEQVSQWTDPGAGTAPVPLHPPGPIAGTEPGTSPAPSPESPWCGEGRMEQGEESRAG